MRRVLVAGTAGVLVLVLQLAFATVGSGKESDGAPDRPGRAGPPTLGPEAAATGVTVPGNLSRGDAFKRARDANGHRFVPGELIVKYARAVGPTKRSTLRNSVEAEDRDPLLLPRAELLTLEEDESVVAAAKALDRRPDVEYALPNYVQELYATPNDPELGKLYGLHNSGQPDQNGAAGTPGADIDAVNAWDTTTGSEDVVVAVIDSGVQYKHPEIAQNLYTNPGEAGSKASNGVDDDGNGLVDDVNGWDFKVGDNDPMDMQGHGTHVAGTIGAQGNNGSGVAGVNWEVSLLPLKIGGVGTSTSVAAGLEAVVYAGKHADVVNGSFGGPAPPEVAQAWDDAVGKSPNTLFVFASGNAGQDVDAEPTYPCATKQPNVVCVGATDNKDQLADFSNFGPGNVDLAAPGVSIFSTYPEFHEAANETFDDGGGNWITGSVSGNPPTQNGYNDWGIFGLGDPPNPVLRSSMSGSYIANNITYALRKGINVSGYENCGFEFTTLYHIEPPDTDGSFFDSLRIFLAPDGDGNTYEKVAEVASSSAEAFNGGQLEFAELKLELDEMVKLGGPDLQGATNAAIEFDLASDANVEGVGALFDDVRFFCTKPTPGGLGYLDGTSMASPHVAGVAGLLQAAKPSATPAQLKQALLDSVDTLSGLSGRVGTGGRLNADRALDAIGTDTGPGGPGGPGAEPGSCEEATAALKKAKRKLNKAQKKLRKAKKAERKAKKKAKRAGGKKAKKLQKKSKKLKKKTKKLSKQKRKKQRKKRRAQEAKILAC